MRPIKLEMTAFGPYSGREIIDFEQLQDRHLFLVTGPTGAGKTTVFDGIAYALYGESSGTDRPVKSLRCDNAPEDLSTEVKLIFELKGDVHQIHRIPSQLKKKVRGEGFTEKKPEATLIKAGKEHPITGVENVTEAIKSLIGLEVGQFRQIMMIPQGEFRKLLMAKSDERTEILKKIFQTTLYGHLQNKFREEKKRLESTMESSLDQRLKEFQRIELDETDGNSSQLLDLINADLPQLDQIVEQTQGYITHEISHKKTLETDQLKIKKEHEKLIEEKTSAVFTNEQLKSFEENKKRLETLDTQMDQVGEARGRLLKIEQAQKVHPLEQSLYKRKEEKNHLEQEVNDLTVSLKKINQEFKTVKNTYESTISETFLNQLKNHQEEILKLKSYIEKVQKVEGLSTSLAGLNNRLDQNRRQQDKLADQSKELDFIEAYCKEKEEKNQILNQHTNRVTFLEELKHLIAQRDTITDKLSKSKEEKKRQEATLEKEKASYLKIKKIWHMNQAALIAKELNQGDPCPVCGATNHIQLATLPDNYVTEEALQEAENGLNQRKDLYYEVDSQIQSFKVLLEQMTQQIEKKKTALTKEGILSEPFNLLEAITDENQQISKLSSELDQINDALKKLHYDDNKTRDLNREKDKLQETLKALEDQFTALQLSVKEEESVKTTLLMDVPKNLQKVDTLNKEINRLHLCLEEMTNKKNQAEKDFKHHSDQSIELSSKLQHAEESLMVMDSLLEEEEKGFFDALKDAGFHTIDTYKTYRQVLNTKEDLREKIIRFDKKHHSIKEIVEKERQLVKTLVYKDIHLFDEQLLTIEREKTALQQKINRLEHRIQHNQQQLELILKLSDDISEVEKEYRLIGHLSDIVNGQNKKKLTFERFILATYLSDVIELANQQLHPMTNNRYTLKISTSVMDKRSSSGLDLEVFDTYTGVDRSVKTLSGGESFKASLAMALALAEVVQAYAGGIQLDTVFIDEGFGTLDQESLDSAINCLVDLQDSGRLVGIISHVQELKERIKSQLVVETNDQGSYTAFHLEG